MCQIIVKVYCLFLHPCTCMRWNYMLEKKNLCNLFATPPYYYIVEARLPHVDASTQIESQSWLTSSASQQYFTALEWLLVNRPIWDLLFSIFDAEIVCCFGWSSIHFLLTISTKSYCKTAPFKCSLICQYMCVYLVFCWRSQQQAHESVQYRSSMAVTQMRLFLL